MTRTNAPRMAIAAAVTAVIGTSAPAMAQLEEVVVTAQKREQGILDVPLSIATLSGERFTSMFEGGADIRALSARVPGLYAESSNGRVAPRFYIRGLGNIDFDLAASQPVSIIMDEVVKENVVLKSFPLFDIERVEVLRGPQGSLFGRNTTAGIVKFDSYKPTQEFEGRLKVDAGSLGTINVEGAVGGGLTDNLTGRVAVLVQNRDDYINNDYTGESDALGGFEENAAKAFLQWDATDSLTFLLGAHYRDLDGTSAIFRANVFDPGSNSLNENYDRETVYFDEGDNNPQEYESTGYNLKIDWDIGGMTLTSITAYDEADGYSLGDIDGGFGAVFLPEMGPGFIPFPSQTADSADTDQLTQEFRLASEYGDRFNWQVGAFYFDSELEVETNPFFIPATTVKHENTTWAVFGQGDYAFTDAWTLTAGLRWTDDEKDFTAPGYSENVSDDQISGDLALSYAADERSLFWAKVGTGFRAPTIQGRDVAFGGAPSVADSETITSFEFGYKSQFFDDTMRFNAALFYYEVEDIQFTAVGGTSNNIQLINADTGTGMGLEMDVEWLLTDNFVMTFGVGYADTEIEDNGLRVGACGSGRCTVTNPVDENGFVLIDGNPFPNAPETTFNVTASYSYPISDASELFVFTDWSYQGDTNIFLYDAKEFQTDGQYEGGFRAGWRRVDRGLEVAVFGRNITDEENVMGAIDFNNLTGFTNEPQVFGVSVSSEF
ncbi:TonB-dependent receptor [Halioglobus sp. HI00S01]|uniref:TonB-dependent receptor n=2 Tax=Halioglobus sp. HI00S01 TaxID=1822214 RepID=UPI0007C3651A|nr:TonB-dependent receptor [Halioglobus sp. HI00S01]KZX58261.1 TonB-dependent receptor [Halioglobus sp. HI00S01]